MRSVKLPPRKSVVVQVQVPDTVGKALLEAIPGEASSLSVGESLLDFTEDGVACLPVTNNDHFTRVIHEDTVMGVVSEATVLDLPSLRTEGEQGYTLLESKYVTTQEDSGLKMPFPDAWYPAEREYRETMCCIPKPTQDSDSCLTDVDCPQQIGERDAGLLISSQQSTSSVKMIRKAEEDLSAERVAGREVRVQTTGRTERVATGVPPCIRTGRR